MGKVCLDDVRGHWEGCGLVEWKQSLEYRIETLESRFQYLLIWRRHRATELSRRDWVCRQLHNTLSVHHEPFSLHPIFSIQLILSIRQLILLIYQLILSIYQFYHLLEIESSSKWNNSVFVNGRDEICFPQSRWINFTSSKRHHFPTITIKLVNHCERNYIWPSWWIQ